MSTIYEEHSTVSESAMQVTHHLQDSRYALTAFRLGQDDYVFLYDVVQRSVFLAQQTRPLDLLALWQKRQEAADYCLACDLMLLFDERWIAVPGELPVELGIDTDRATRLLQALKSGIPSLQDVEGR